MTLNVLSLFAGIGGLDLGLEREGMTTVGQVELDPFCQRVLARHWPEVPRHDDVRTTPAWWAREQRPPVHVVAGGYPCPAFSQAARGRNVAPNLWPAMRDVIADLRPDYVLLENVAAHLGRGFPAVLESLNSVEVATAHGPAAAHITSWHPAVALAVAARLDAAAWQWEQVDRDQEWPDSHKTTVDLEDDLAIARVYLGSQP